MTRTMKRTALGVLSAATLLLAGCGGGGSTVTYSVEGSGTADITYTGPDGSETVEGASLPWTVEAEGMRSGDALDLTVENPSDPASTTCSIARGGEVTHTDEGSSVSGPHCYDYGN